MRLYKSGSSRNDPSGGALLDKNCGACAVPHLSTAHSKSRFFTIAHCDERVIDDVSSARASVLGT